MVRSQILEYLVTHDKDTDFPWGKVGGCWGISKERYDRVELYFDKITLVAVWRADRSKGWGQESKQRPVSDY